MKVVRIEEMPKLPWEPPKGHFYGTITLFDRWIGLYANTYFLMRHYRVKRS